MRRCPACDRITGEGPVCQHCHTALDQPTEAVSGHTYSMGVLGIVAVASIGLASLANTAMGLYPLLGRQLAAEEATLDAAYAIYAILGLTLFVTWLPPMVLFIVWLWRARKNLDAFPDTARPSLGAGWAIGGWFIPFANLVIPCRVVYQVASHTLDRRWFAPAVGIWWGTLLIDNILSRLGGDPPAGDDPATNAAWFADEAVLGVASTLLVLTAAICISAIVLSVSRAQQHRIDTATRFVPAPAVQPAP